MVVISCDLDTPESPSRTNPLDGRNPETVPEVVSINTSASNGFTNSTNTQVFIESKAASQIRLCEVVSQGASLDAQWQDVDTLLNVQLSTGDGEKWIGCQAKALNGNVSAPVYSIIKLDTHVEISSFTWSTTGGDTLVPDDTVTFHLETGVDAFGSETGGVAIVTLPGWEDINLFDNADGSYTGRFLITSETRRISNVRVKISLMDRVGNRVIEESNQFLTAWWSLAPGTERIFSLGNSGESIIMCWMPPGSFEMGSRENDPDRNSNEDPLHHVSFQAGFWMGKYEVTQAQWMAVMGNNPSAFNGVNNPVDDISWDDIQGFETMLENTFRLPSEAEWEYACRAGTTSRFFWGSDQDFNQIHSKGWYYYNSSMRTHSVGEKTPNNWGLHDMSGNVLEWCEDRYHDNYVNAPSDGSAWIGPSGSSSSRILRGGSWFCSPEDCRSALRNEGNWGGRNYYRGAGFRLVLFR